MKISKFDKSGHTGNARERELRELLQQPSDKERRPCSACNKLCACQKHSNRCCCGCSPDCLDAPRYLSSEPDRYPIERHVVPLVYALSTLRLAPPCWSCEGHVTSNNQVMRLPQVWFYSETTLLPELIAEYLSELAFRKQLFHPWEVAVCPHTEGGATVFNIKPVCAETVDTGSAQLRDLQQDLHVIASSLVEKTHQLAQKKLANMRSDR